MSSIVRKGQTLFTPKLKKNITRRKQTPATSTPPTTQEPSQSDENSPNKHPSLPTPQSTQVSFYNKTKDTSAVEEDVDPMDTSKKVDLAPAPPAIPEQAVEEDEDEEDYGDNDIFKRPIPEPIRRRSSVSQRRLSSISLSKPSSRGGSITLSVTPRGSFSEHDRAIPIPIEIPMAKGKRRRSSVMRPVKRVSIAEPRSNSVTETAQEITVVPPSNPASRALSVSHVEADIHEEQIEEELEPESETITEVVPEVEEVIKRDDLFNEGKYVIYAVDPESESKSLRQYRTGDLVDKDVPTTERLLPLAPDEVIMRISSIKQIPIHLRKADHILLSNVKIDTDKMSMRDLCNPSLPIGQTSSNYDMVRAAAEKRAKAKQERRNARELAKKERISYEEALERVALRKSGLEEDGGVDVKDVKSTKEEAKKEEPEPPQIDTKPRKGLQLNITGGKLDIDTESTVVQRNVYGTGDRQREEINPFEKPVISNTYSKRQYTDKWDPQEEMEFYKALSTWGTDFSLISNLFPHRTRKQIKSKYNNEERRRPELIDMALRRRFVPDLQEYAANTNVTIETIEEFEAARKRIKEEMEIQKKEIIEAREKAIREDAEKNRLKEIERKAGLKPLQRLTKGKQLRQNEEVVGTL